MYLSLEDFQALGVDDTYKNHSIGGKCSGCGECCVDMLPATIDEIHRIKEYVQKHHIREHRQAPFFDPKATDFSCPFRNQQERKCEVYPARLYICRTFVCNKTREDAIRDRDLIHRDRKIYSLRFEVFGNPETLGLVAAIAVSKSKRALPWR